MRYCLFLVVCAALAPVPVLCEVVDAAANGFTVKSTVTIKAAPAEVYRTLTSEVGAWWNPSHTFSRDAKNLHMDARPGGCFCETLPGGGGVRHMEVVITMPGKALLLHGGMGPLLSVAAAGALEFALAPVEGGTQLNLTYAVGGYLKTGLDAFARPVDNVLAEQIGRLKNYIEQGKPAEVK